MKSKSNFKKIAIFIGIILIIGVLGASSSFAAVKSVEKIDTLGNYPLSNQNVYLISKISTTHIKSKAVRINGVPLTQTIETEINPKYRNKIALKGDKIGFLSMKNPENDKILYKTVRSKNKVSLIYKNPSPKNFNIAYRNIKCYYIYKDKLYAENIVGKNSKIYGEDYYYKEGRHSIIRKAIYYNGIKTLKTKLTIKTKNQRIKIGAISVKYMENKENGKTRVKTYYVNKNKVEFKYRNNLEIVKIAIRYKV